MYPPYTLVSLVTDGGTPVQLVDQTGAPFPTTGTGPLVFANGPNLISPVLDTPTFNDPIFIGTYTFENLIVNNNATISNNLDIGGSITSGIWHGSVIGIAYGGTAAATAQAAAQNLSTVYTVANITALRALTSVPPTVFMQGYATANDGGEGLWEWVAGSAVADNTGTVVQCASATAGRYFRVVEDTLRPEWFGAKGDGSTNDTSAFNAAISACNNQSLLLDPAKVGYPIAVTIGSTSGCTGMISNGGRARLVRPSTATISTNIIYCQRGDFEIENLFFDLPISTDPAVPPLVSYAFRVDLSGSAGRVVFNNNRVKGGRGCVAIYGTGAAETYITNNLFEQFWMEALTLTINQNVYITGNTIQDGGYSTPPGSGAIRISAPSGILAENVIIADNIIKNCMVSSVENSIDCFMPSGGRNISITGNICDLNGGGIELKTEDSVPAGNVYKNILLADNIIRLLNTPGINQIGIALNLSSTTTPDGKAADILISGNKIVMDAPPASAESFSGIIASCYDNVTIVGNSITNTVNGIQIAPINTISTTMRDMSIVGNIVKVTGSGIYCQNLGTLENLRVTDNNVDAGTAFFFTSATTNNAYIANNFGKSSNALAALGLTNCVGGLITGNTFECDAAYYGVYVYGSGTSGVIVSNNNITTNATTGLEAVRVNAGNSITLLSNQISVPDSRAAYVGAGTITAANNVRGTKTGTPTTAGSVGDVWFNSTPSYNGVQSWVCTTAGNSGVAVYAPVNLSAGYTVANLAALKALTTRPTTVFMQGYSTINDGGQGMWEWVAGSSTIANDGTVVQCTSGAAGRYFRIYSTEKNVKWWGAVGDGVNIDKTAIQAAVDDGGVIVFPTGTYKIDGQIYTTSSKLTIRGNGQATIKMSAGQTGSGLIVNADNFTCSGMTFDASDAQGDVGGSYFGASLYVSGSYYSVTSCRFIGGVYNPRLPGTYPAPYYGLYVGDYSGNYALYTNGFVSDITVSGGNVGVIISGGRRLEISRVVATGCAGFGMIIGNGLSVQEVSVSQCEAVSCGLYGFSNSGLFGGAGVDPQPMTNWVLTNMQASYCGWRSFLDGRYGAIGAGKYGYDITDNGLNNFYMQAIAKDCCHGGMESKAGYFSSYDTTLTTNASTASGAVLSFASTTGVYVGMAVAGTNIPADTYVQSKTTTSVTLTRSVTGTVANGASIAFTVGITPGGHKNVSIDFQYVTSVATPNVSGQAADYLLEDSVSNQFFGEKQYAKMFATTKQATSFRSGLHQNPYQVMASDGSLWLCFGTVATGAAGYTGQTAPAGGKYVLRATNAATASGTVLSFASVTDIVAGQAVFGINIPDGTTVASVDPVGLTVTLSQAVTGSGVSNGANIIFGTLVSDGNLYWFCLGTDYSGSTLNNNVAFQINCASYIYADVVSIGNGYGVYLNSNRGVANAIDNVTVTARVIDARYGVQLGGTGTTTNIKFLSCDVSADVAFSTSNGGTNTVDIIGGKYTGTANTAAILLPVGTNNISLSGDPYFYATTGRALYGTGGTNTISITSATFDGGVNGTCPCDFTAGTYTVYWGNTTIINRNGSNQYPGYRNTGTATLTTYGGPLRRDLSTAPLTTTKGNIGEHMVLAAPTSTVWGYVCTAADFVTPNFTWKQKVLA